MKNNDLKNKEIAIYALYLLGGINKRIHTEDVALKCFKIAPSKFSWSKYPKYPDLAPTRFALESAKKNVNGNLVEGESEKKKNAKNIGGWRLTINGVEWIKINKSRIESFLGKKKPLGDRLETDRMLKAIMQSEAFIKFRRYNKSAEITRAEFAESLICTVNTDKTILNERLDQILNSAVQHNRLEVKEFIDFCKQKFVQILT